MQSARVIVIDIPGTTLQDWTAAPMPTVRNLATRGATGLLLARGPQSPCLPADPAASLASAISTDLTPLHVSVQTYEERLADATFPTGIRTDLDMIASQSPFASVALVEIDDALRADCATDPRERDRLVGLSLRRADQFIESIFHPSEPNDSLIVMSSIASRARSDHGSRLTAIVMIGPSITPGSVLTSATTQRSGVVTLDDIAPTIGRLEGSTAKPARVRALRSVRGSWTQLLTDSREYIHALAIRAPILRLYVWLSSFILAAAIGLVLAGRGAASRGRIPRTSRDVLGFAVAAVVAVPATTLLEPLLRLHSTKPAIVAIFAGAIALVIAIRIVTGPRRVIPLIAAITLIVTIADLAAGAPLAARSAISYTIASGPRFHGIGNELMGVVVAAALLWAAAAFDRAARQRVAVCAVLGAIVAFMAAPSIGAKFGSSFVAVPAFGMLGAKAFGFELRNRAIIIGIAIATLFTAGIAALADFLASPTTQTLVANVAASRSSRALSSKIGAVLHLIAGSYWTAAILVPAAALALVFWKRPTLAARAMWGRPSLRSSIVAAAVACMLAIAFNDAGVEAAGLIALIVGAAAAHAMLIENA
ncbi:MAG: hypothetical protein ACYDCC_15150 [Actinomycetota bacterium]